jgi:uncharacterized DUF497 family protein
MFIWDDNNEEHIAKHRVETFEAEYVVKNAKRPYPRSDGGKKYQVRGQTLSGRRLQVIYVRREPHEVDISLLSLAERIALMEGEALLYVIHARELRKGEY